MKTAVIYARYSSDRQTEQSIEGQLRVCNDYAARNDIVVVDTYIDRAMTGTNDKRAAFQRMLRDSAKRAWDVVLVYKIDRFGRNKYELAMNKHTLKSNGIRLISAMENIPDSPEGIILESLLEGFKRSNGYNNDQIILALLNYTNNQYDNKNSRRCITIGSLLFYVPLGFFNIKIFSKRFEFVIPHRLRISGLVFQVPVYRSR